jgi:hypothetical protein
MKVYFSLIISVISIIFKGDRFYPDYSLTPGDFLDTNKKKKDSSKKNQKGYL